MKFAFIARMTVEAPVLIEAETEQAAWKIALDGTPSDFELGDPLPLRKPTFRRNREKDDFGL